MDNYEIQKLLLNKSIKKDVYNILENNYYWAKKVYYHYGFVYDKYIDWEKIYLLLQEYKSNYFKMFIESINDDNLDIIEFLIYNGIDPSYQNNRAIILASKNGHIKVVELLLKDSRVDPSDNYNRAIILALHYGHEKIANLLSKDTRVDPKAYNTSIGYETGVTVIIEEICIYGPPEKVEILNLVDWDWDQNDNVDNIDQNNNINNIEQNDNFQCNLQ